MIKQAMQCKCKQIIQMAINKIIKQFYLFF